MICSTGYEQSDWESTRRWFESVRSYEENNFQQQGWSTPTEIDINDGELFDISSASTSGVWDWTAEIETVNDIATLRPELPTEVHSPDAQSHVRMAAVPRPINSLRVETDFDQFVAR